MLNRAVWTGRSLALSGVSAVAMAVAWGAGAQAQTASSDTSAGVAVEDVIVTATRREERLSTVPIAVSVANGQTLRDNNLNTLRNVTSIIPSLNFRDAASAKDQAFFLRGLGTVSTSSAAEPSVSTVIDGVVLSRQGAAMLDLLDVERIEVLRGPQGTLFGKNASAGVINIVSEQPSDRPHGYLDGFYGTGGNEYRLRGSATGPLAPQLSGSVNVLYGHYDGNVTNLFNGEKVNGYDRYGAVGKLRYTFGTTADVVLSTDYVHSNESTPTGVVTRTYRVAYPTNVRTDYPQFAAAISPVVPSASNTAINSDFKSYAIDDNGGVSLQANIFLGDYTLTSITARREYDNTQHQDQDRAPVVVTGVPQSHDIGHLNSNQTTQEFRLTSPKDKFLTYVAGLYVFDWEDRESYRRDTLMVSGASKVPNFGVANWTVGNQNYSAFGEMTFHMLPGLRGILGARLVQDSLDYNFARVSSSPAVAVPSIQVNFNSNGKTSFTGYADRAGLEADVPGVGLAYFTYSRGYKGPAYNVAFSMLPQDTGVVRPEINTSYEVGLKAHTPGGRLAGTIAAFDSTVSNYQVNFVDLYNGSQVTRFINAGAVSTRGVEADFNGRLLPGLTVSGAGAYTSAHVDHFACPPGAAVSCNIDGGVLPFAPHWKANARLAYFTPIAAGGGIELSTDYDWRSQVQFSINETPDSIQGAYGIWNAGATLTGFAGLRLSVIVKNIADQHYATTLTTFGAGVVRYVPRDDSRYVGFGVRKTF